MSAIKHYLRKFEFPSVAKEALLQLEQLSCHGTSTQQQRLIQDVIEEFIFCEVDRRGLRKKKLNALQELQLLEVLSHHFTNQHNDVIRNTLFLTLFHFESGYVNKIKFLAKIVSLGIATRNASVLSSSAVWMQQQGCTSDIVISLIREIISDYFHLIPRSAYFLIDLPLISTHFTAHFITASTALYGSTEKFDLPLGLIQMITWWVASNSQLCLTPLTTNLQNSLPKGSIIMPSMTPLPGLIRWCVEAPILESVGSQIAGSNDLTNSKQALYSQLHTGVLDSVMESLKIKHQMVQKEIISIRDFIALIESLLSLCNKYRERIPSEASQSALDRFGQALQVSIAMSTLQGNIGELCWHLRRLPENRLLKMILKKSR